MGVFKLFSADSRSYEPCSEVPKQETFINSNNPDPSNFIIMQYKFINRYTILKVKYPDCTNYEGEKILVYDEGFNVDELIRSKRLDPHFFTEGDSPIARFEPTKRGWTMAEIFVHAMGIFNFNIIP